MTLTETEVLIYGEIPKCILRILLRITVMMKKVKFSIKATKNSQCMDLPISTMMDM